MTQKQFLIDHIPAVLYGDAAEKAYLFVHGQCGCKEEGLAFAKIACPAGYQVLAIDLPEHGARKGEENRFNPWTVVPELKTVFAYMKSRWSEIGVRANSIGAHFAMLAFAGEELHKALFVSPIVNMERLITDMMQWAGVTEQELHEKGDIATNFGQTLSWRYLTWEREHPVQNWRCPTAILYAGQDNMTARKTVEQFVATHNATLTIMKNGEHWFHTPEQLGVLQTWEMSATKE
ncbi:MAG: alpha/beta hydrolase [Oscillospiraceae bacterium]|nr:alpha/beta hydrolase [Oscillospiraceae bacterium]